MERLLQFGMVALWVTALTVARGQPGCAGSLDLGFDIGSGVDPDRAAPASIEAVMVQTDGKVVIEGHFESLCGITRQGLARFQPDGSLDSTIDYSTLEVRHHTSAVQPDGKQLKVVQDLDGEGRYLIRVRADGELDPSFVAALPARFVAKAIALQPDSKVLVGGGMPPNPPSAQARTVERAVIRLNADGSIDPSFSTNISIGVWGDERTVSALLGLYDLVLDSEGKIYVGGLFTAVNGVRRTDVFRLHPDGSLDLTFEPNISICLGCDADATETVSAMALCPDGKLVIGGYFTTINGVSRRSVARLHTASGGCPGVISFSETTYYFRETDQEARIPVVRRGDTNLSISVHYATDSFSPDALSALPGGDYLSQSNVLVLAAGHSQGTISIPLLNDAAAEPNKNFYLRLDAPTDGAVLGWPAQARITIVDDESLGTPGSLDQEFQPQLKAESPWDSVEGIATEPAGRILVRGSFKSIDGVPAQGFAVLTADGRRERAWNNILDGRVTCFSVLPAQDRMLLGGEFQTVNGAVCRGLALLRTDGSLDSSFGAQLDGAVTALQALANGSTFVAGSFRTVNGSDCGGLACLDPGGALNSTFRVGAKKVTDGSIWNIVVQPDGDVLVAGQFWQVQGRVSRHLARFHRDGSLDLDFEAGFGDASVCVYDLMLDASGNIVVAGFFEQLQGVKTGPIVRLNSNGVLDREFHTDFHGVVHNVLLQPDGKILVAGEMSSVSRPFHNLARLNPDGSLDHSFDCPWATDGCGIGALARQSNGDILIGGAFTEVNSLPRPYLARLRGSATFDQSTGGVPLSQGYMVALRPCSPGPDRRLQVFGRLGRTYTIEASTDLKNWSTIGVGTQASGALEFTDLQGCQLPQRFYRATSQEP